MRQSAIQAIEPKIGVPGPSFSLSRRQRLISVPSLPIEAGLSVVVPIYNERESLVSLVAQVTEAASSLGRDWELLLVDDGSDTATKARLGDLAGDQVRVLRLDRNRGQSVALLAGFAASRYSVIATMDGDLQNDPRDFQRLLEALESADMVCGFRENRQDSHWRRWVSSQANRIRNALTGDGVRDTGCSLKVMRREVLERVRFFQGAHRFMPALAQLEGFRVVEVPVSHRGRLHGETKYGNWQRLRATVPDLLGFLWMKSRYAEFLAEELR